MDHLDTTHRLDVDRALCGERDGLASTLDAAVTCPTCRALLELAARRRRELVRRSVRLIGALAVA